MDLSSSLSGELGLKSLFGLKTLAIVETLGAKYHGTANGGRDQQFLTQRDLLRPEGTIPALLLLGGCFSCL